MSKPTQPTIIIAHSAFRQAAHYIDFDAALHEVGLQEVRIPQLPSAGQQPPPDAFAQDVAVLRKTINSCLHSGRDVMLLAHSYGAMPLSDALAEVPVTTNKQHVKVLGVVFVAGMIPEEGEDLGKAMKAGVEHVIQVKGDLCYPNIPAEDPKPTKEGDRMLPQSMASFTTPVTTASWSNYPCAYVKCTKDTATGLREQDYMIAKLRRRCEWQPAVAQLESGHDPFTSMPLKLAGMVKALVDDAL